MTKTAERTQWPTPVAPILLGPVTCLTCGDWLWWDGWVWRERRPGPRGAPPRWSRHDCPRTRQPEPEHPFGTPLHVLTERWRTQ